MEIYKRVGLKWNIVIVSMFLITVGMAAVNRKHGKDTKILIIGAGMSGVAAGKRLYDAGYTNIMVLEATDRIGGRVKNEQLQDQQVEVGAQWIYGVGDNPIYKLALEYNLSMKRNLGNDSTMYDESGNNVTEISLLAYEQLRYIMDKLDRFARKARKEDKDDFTLRAGLRHMGWRPETVIDDAVEVILNDWEDGTCPSSVSGKYYTKQEMFEDFGSSEIMFVDDQRGFVYLIEALAHSFNDTNGRFKLNVPVKEIVHTDDEVVVKTDYGDEFVAQFAIVTVPLSVLQHRQITFSPEFPANKQLAIDKFGMGDYAFIYLKFNNSFWDDTLFLFHASNTRGKMTIWMNLNRVYPGSNMLQLSLMGEFARWVGVSSDEDVIYEVIFTLEYMYPNIRIPNPLDYKISRWATDPNFMGAFSFWPPAFTERDMKKLGQNVGRVYFAGEYAHPKYFGYVHGAYLSGIHTAETLIKCIEDDSYCSSETSPAPQPSSSHRQDMCVYFVSLLLYCAYIFKA